MRRQRKWEELRRRKEEIQQQTKCMSDRLCTHINLINTIASASSDSKFNTSGRPRCFFPHIVLYYNQSLKCTFTVPKHVQLIQFSLLSAPEGEWMVRPESAMKHQTPKQNQEALKREKALKKKEQERLRRGILLPKTIERLKQV